MKEIMIYESEKNGIHDFEIGNALEQSLESMGKRLQRVLLIPPDYSRKYSFVHFNKDSYIYGTGGKMNSL